MDKLNVPVDIRKYTGYSRGYLYIAQDAYIYICTLLVGALTCRGVKTMFFVFVDFTKIETESLNVIVL